MRRWYPFLMMPTGSGEERDNGQLSSTATGRRTGGTASSRGRAAAVPPVLRLPLAGRHNGLGSGALLPPDSPVDCPPSGCHRCRVALLPDRCLATPDTPDRPPLRESRYAALQGAGAGGG